MSYEFRKIIKSKDKTRAISISIDNRSHEFDTIGLFERKNGVLNLNHIDEMTDEEMERFRAQDDFEEVLTKLE